jgi:hypothetical protein
VLKTNCLGPSVMDSGPEAVMDPTWRMANGYCIYFVFGGMMLYSTSIS